MSKIGIITFHRAENFGAVLQCYALQEFLRSKGHDAYVIDYKNREIESNYEIINPWILISRKNIVISIKKYFYRFKFLKKRLEKKSKYRNFRGRYLRLLKVRDVSSLDYVIAGSDQIWNMHLTGGFDSMYFLSHKCFENVGKLSYAASTDNNTSSIIYKESRRISKALADFKVISVREQFLKDIMSDIVDKDISVTLDPSLLLSAEEYQSIADPVSERSYVLLYQMTWSQEGRALAEKIANKNGWSMVEVLGGYGKSKNNIISFASPTELLGLISNAKIVVTTSFHGIVFSLIFHKEFWVIDVGDNLRQKNILNKVGLNCRLVSCSEDANIFMPIDYNRVETELSQMRKSSADFLCDALV